MSLQWTLVAGFLYAEIFVILLMMLPFVSATMWQKLFKSRFLRSLAEYSNFYFSAFFVILLLLFLDSIRQMQKYSYLRDQEADHAHLDAELQHNMKMFRAQRNCYIAGFALFLALVIRRIASLISKQAELIASTEATLKQAKSATQVAERLMKENDEKKKKLDSNEMETKENKVYQEQLENLKNELEVKSKELERAKLDLSVLREQAEGNNREYDKLLKEHEKLQETLKASGDNESKKDE